ncbi:MAG TPA: histidine kinase [Taishania sp.]|nr:histidine kinase [Taishania sp.]
MINAALSQRLFFQSYSTPQGLAQSQVTSITQDSVGYLWIGTLGGISQFNGSTFRNYSTDNGLLNNRINSLTWINHLLYIGHQGGISIKDRNVFKSTPLPNKLNNINVTDIVKFKDQVVVSTNGAGLYSYNKGKLTALNLLHDDYVYIRDLFIWEDELYIATRNGIVRTNDLKSIDYFLEEYDISISAIAVRNNKLIISTFYDGVLIYDKQKKKVVNQLFEKEGDLLNNVFVDSRNNLWISSSNGIIKYNDKEYSTLNSQVGLPLDIVSTVFEDSDHNIWLGTQGKGLVKAAQGEISYFDKNTGLPSDLIISGFQSNDNTYYFGTMDAGVVITKNFKDFKTIPLEQTIWCAIGDIDDKHWFGTRNGLFSLDHQGNIKRYSLEDGIPGFKITAFHKINSKQMYIGGSHGIVLYEHGTLRKIGTNGSELGAIRSIILYHNMLILGTDYGLFKLSKNKEFELIDQFNRSVYAITKTESGRLFIGTEVGLYELQNDLTIRRIRYSSDVASNYINFLSNNGNELLIGTNNGVYVINTSNSKLAYKRIGNSDGLIDPETNLNSSFIDKKGNLWFGTTSGLIKLNLNKFNRKQEKVRLQLKNILLNYEHFNYGKFGASYDKVVPQNMVFPYNKNNLQFYFDAVSLNNYDNIQFQYRVDGLDNKWMPSTNVSSLTLSGLHAGEYTVYARLILTDGTVMDEMAINFIVKQAFFRTWWFISFIAIFIVSLIILYVRFRFKREQEKNELERAAYKARLVSLEQQSLNASMNRHFIFNSLNSIQYFINISDKLSANKYLSNFAKLIRKNLDSSTDESNMETLAEEIDRIKLYLSLESLRFKDKFEYHIKTNNVDLESIKIPAMMIQPFIENSIIHGILPKNDQLGKVELIIKEDAGYLVIEIKDNGIGVETSLNQKMQIAGDHKSKRMEITMKRIQLLKDFFQQEIDLIGPKQVYSADKKVIGTLVQIKIALNNLEN